ncbi:MAG: DUF4440 domain-containing protein [Euryarchaeota archaeon]|nr:DUF4440 domain-containing protein [Euryarchaeota archaeon]|tara:strand:+ start:621 stop:1049 length:429 start_codon:yes stop_codon:yes gene_type:complete
MFKQLATYLLCLYSLSAWSQIQVPGMPDEVHKTMKDQQNAWNDGDIDAFMNGYWESDSLLFIGSSGVNNGYLKTLSNYKKSYPNKDAMGSLTFNNRSWTPLSDNTALLIGSWRISEEQHGMYSLIWKVIDGRWVIIADHSSS